jgi:hypothetical protein
MVLDTFAGLDQLGTESLSTKVQPHRLSQVSDDVISQLGQPPLFLLSEYLLNIYTGQTFDFIEVQTAPSTVVANKETREDQLHQPPFPLVPSCQSIDRGTCSLSKSHMPDVSNRQTPSKASCDVEENRDLTSPAGFKGQRHRHVPGRAAATMKACEATTRGSPDSLLATSTIPSAPRSPAVSTPPTTALNSLLPSHSSAAVLEDPLPQSRPDQRQLDEAGPESRSDRQLASSASAQQTGQPPPDRPSRYMQAFTLMTSLFGTTLSPAKLITVIRTGDRLIRDDAVPFLKEQLPLWEGMWYKSNLSMPSSDDSVTDHFVKVSRYIAVMKERSITDRIRVLLHKVLQYQFYLRSLEEVKHKVKDSEVKKKRGIRDAVYALDHLLESLYVDDWGLIGSAEKQRRRNLLHKQKHLGKRLLTLSTCMGFGILLLGSSEAMGRM